jgi:hypothetical protein
MRGRLGLAEPEGWSRAGAQHWNYAIKGIIAYDLVVGNTSIYSWDFFANKLVIGPVAGNSPQQFF